MDSLSQLEVIVYVLIYVRIYNLFYQEVPQNQSQFTKLNYLIIIEKMLKKIKQVLFISKDLFLQVL